MKRRPIGLSELDLGVWQSFLRLYPLADQSAEYNVRVGGGRHAQLHQPEFAHLPGAEDWRKRIDVLIDLEELAFVVELKPWATAQAIGQAVLYARLYANEHGGGFAAVPVVVSRHIDADLLQCLEYFPCCGYAVEPNLWWGHCAELFQLVACGPL